MTLACEYANSKLVADVDAEDCVGNSLLQILELRFDEFEVDAWSEVKMKFDQDLFLNL